MRFKNYFTIPFLKKKKIDYSFFENAAIGMMLVSPEGKFLKVNNKFSEITGYSEEELLKKTFRDITHPDDIEKDLSFVKDAVQGKLATYTTEKRYIHKNNTVVWINLHTSIVTNSNNKLLYFIAQAENITESKKSAATIIHEKTLSETIINGLPGIFYVADKDGNMLRWNKNVESLVGYNAAEIATSKTTDFTDEMQKELILSKRAEAFEKGKASAEINIITKQKQRLDYYITIIPISYNDQPCILGMGIDFTEKKKAELGLQKINHDIGERVKELTCLYFLTKLANDPEKSMDDILQGCVNIIPPSYQYPEITTARIIFGDQSFESPAFSVSVWKQEAIIRSNESNIGLIEIFYTSQMPDEQEGPFLKEERLLIDSIADIISSAAERRKAEAAIREQAEMFQAIIENTKESIYLISLDYKLLQFNKTAQERMRLSRGIELSIGIDFREALFPQILDLFLSMFDDALKGKSRSEEKKAQGITGEYFWFQAKTSPVLDPNGKLIGVTLLTEGINDRKKAEAELRESEEKFRTLVEQSLVGVYIIQNNLLVYVNPGFEKIFGYSKDQMINNMSFEWFIHPDDLEMIQNNYSARIKGETTNPQYIFRGIKSDGSVLHLEVIVSMIIYNGAPAVIGTLIDITNRVEEENRIEKAVTEAQENERIQIGMELHDNVKQMLAASIMSLGRIKYKFTNKEKEDKEGAIEIVDTVKDYIMEAINELRRLSHQLAPTVDKEESLTEKIEKLVDIMNTNEQLKVYVSIDEFEPPLKNDIQIAFYRILQEQFNNIMKYAHASSVLISIKLLDKIVYLTIKDDGKGFDTSVKKEGIGLENIKRRATVLGGQVKIISTTGNGCTVNVQIPLN